MLQTALLSTILYPFYWHFPGNQDSEGLKTRDTPFTVPIYKYDKYGACSSYLHFARVNLFLFWSACKDHFGLNGPEWYFWTPGEIKGPYNIPSLSFRKLCDCLYNVDWFVSLSLVITFISFLFGFCLW